MEPHSTEKLQSGKITCVTLMHRNASESIFTLLKECTKNANAYRLAVCLSSFLYKIMYFKSLRFLLLYVNIIYEKFKNSAKISLEHRNP